MALKVPNGGELLILAELIAYFDSLVLHLYKNNYTPIDTSVVGDFTSADFDGYASIALGPWGAPYTNGAGKAETDETVRTFTMTGAVTPNTIYGYTVQTAGGALVWAERNPAGGILLDGAGQVYSVLPRFTGKSEF